MKALIFDGSPEGDSTGIRVTGELGNLLAAAGYDAEHVVLRERTIGNCNGCFQCWLKTPGICVIDDDNRELSRRMIASDLLVLLTPVTFGGYSPELKKMLDHLIANISPFFARIDGETHHRRRYDSYPDLLAVGWQNEPDARQEAVFRHLVLRNSINFYSAGTGCTVIQAKRSPDEIRGELTALLSNFRNPKTQSDAQQLSLPEPSALNRPVRKAVLLVGSPRMTKSSSASLGGYLVEELESRGVITDTFQIHKALRDDDHLARLLEAVDNADLSILAFPLYIDSIPAPTLTLMSMIGERCGKQSPQRGFAAIVNCGFIEAFHNDTALGICAEFARESGFTWMGGVSIGGGEGLVHGRPFRTLGGPAIPFKKALVRVAEAFAEGQPVPDDARQQLARPFVPGWVYRIVGSMNWKKQARRNGILQKLGDQPYRRA
ncbi:MAG: NADPH-dependent FMN reductase [Chlorobi bacterium]|nr:NADPH-dependent FMN reductase [Chlorobiota bacterium]